MEPEDRVQSLSPNPQGNLNLPEADDMRNCFILQQENTNVGREQIKRGSVIAPKDEGGETMKDEGGATVEEALKTPMEGVNVTAEEGEAGQENDEDLEMLDDDKKAVFNAVSQGDIDLLEELLRNPKMDINVIWYNENLLMAAIRAGQTVMAEYLLDNGVDQSFATTLIDVKEYAHRRRMDWYTYSCRQMASDHEMFDVVELIDFLNGELPHWIKLRERTVRYLPKPDPNLENSDTMQLCDTSDVIPEHAHNTNAEENNIENMDSKKRPNEKEEQKGQCTESQIPTKKVVFGPSDDQDTSSLKNVQGELVTKGINQDLIATTARQQQPSLNKMTKGSMLRQLSFHSKDTQQEHPLRRPKVRATGSYTVESPRWHSKTSASQHTATAEFHSTNKNFTETTEMKEKVLNTVQALRNSPCCNRNLRKVSNDRMNPLHLSRSCSRSSWNSVGVQTGEATCLEKNCLHNRFPKLCNNVLTRVSQAMKPDENCRRSITVDTYGRTRMKGRLVYIETVPGYLRSTESSGNKRRIGVRRNHAHSTDSFTGVFRVSPGSSLSLNPTLGHRNFPTFISQRSSTK